VVSRLYAPGDSENLVEGLAVLSWLLVPEYAGVGGTGRS
jgi:hypothetical protein